MKNILCFGDSNTYGYNPAKNGMRFDYEMRWTGILQKTLGAEYRIIEEGYNGRTILVEDFLNPDKSSKNYIAPCVLSHQPLDLIAICLGANDLKKKFNFTALDIMRSMKELIRIIRALEFESKIPQILIMPPICLGEGVERFFDGVFNENSVKECKKLPAFYKELSELIKCHYFNPSEFVKASPIDCIHLDEAGHKIMAEVLFKKIKEIV